MVTVIRAKDVNRDKKFEPPYSIEFGICNDTVHDPKMVLGHTVSPPGARIQRHYHVNCDVGQYRIRGYDRMIVGPDHEKQAIDVGPGDFVFIPRGIIHGGLNLSDTEPGEVIFCYIGVGSIEESKTIKIEPPPKAGQKIDDPVKIQASMKGEKGTVTVIRSKDLKSDKKYEPPYGIKFGICDDTVDHPKMVMGHTAIPPGSRVQRHYHVNCDVGQYRIKGHTRMIVGPEHERQEIDVGPGEFVFIPRGEIHGGMNLSEAEPGEVVFCYIGVGSTKEAKTIKIEPPWEYKFPNP